jgi:hypothetical protein
MGILSIVASLVKGIAWTKIAGAVVEYAPGLYRLSQERCQPAVSPLAAEADNELQERLVRLEKLLLEQEELIRARVATIEQLEKRCQELANGLFLLKVTAGVLALTCIILLAVLFT